MRNRIILSLLVVIVALGNLLAQHGHLMPTLELTTEMKTELGLTVEQVTSLEQLQQETKAAMTALHERTDLDHEGKRAAAREIHQSTKEQVAEILTEEQLTHLKELHAAQRAERRELMESVDHKAMRAELHEYKKTEIAPVMHAQRLKLEEAISSEDQASLAAIRATLNAAKAAAKEEHREHKAQQGKPGEGHHGAKRGHDRPHHGHGHKFRRLEENHPAEFAALKAMVDKYDTDINRLFEEVKPQQEEWRAAQKAIMERYIPADLRRQEASGLHHEDGNKEHAEHAKLAHKIHFLLKDPHQDDEDEVVETSAVERIAASTYPNPTTNTTILTFELPETMTMRIDLRDENGALVKNIAQEQFRAGQHKVAVDLGDVQNGTYYFTLNSRALKAPQSVKLIVLK
ncbi:T9SS type A sorting domain-containing protein [Lewinella sp. LCG006]|uniref:T9SS type A sorting domain-containing protein n=1 Tax=Lewinella sp. LCG006 TaxID=3231911 RepID=UPI0034602323